MRGFFVSERKENDELLAAAWTWTTGIRVGQGARTFTRTDTHRTAQSVGIFSGRTYDDLYREFASYCAQFDAPFALCGLSLGAVLALHYTLEYPQKVGALCLIAPQYRMPKRLMVMQDFIFRILPASAFEETGLDRQQMRRLTRSMMQLDFTRKLQQIDIPVRILCGEKDRANQKAAQELASRVKTAELHWVAGVGHEVNEQAPARLAAELTDFLNSVG